MKKIIPILIIILFVAAVGVGVYFGWQKTKEILTPPADNLQPAIDNQQQSFLTTLKPKLKIISDQPAFDYFVYRSFREGGLDNSTGDVFYVSQDGKIFKIREEADELVSDRIIDNIIKVKASNDGAMLIVQYGDRGASKLEIFDVEKKVWQALGGNISAADFSPDGLKLVYLEKTTNGVSNLIIKDLNAVKPKTTKILSLTQVGFDLKWISAEKVLLIAAPSIDYVSEIWQVDIKNKTMKLFLGDKGLMIKWNTENSLGLQANRKNQLNLIDDSGNIKANIEILSLPDKCLLTASKIYCAVIQNYADFLPKPTLPDDYLKKALYSKDKIYMIDMENSSSEVILSDEFPPAIDAVNLMLNGNNLLFLNRYDERVYSLTLM